MSSFKQPKGSYGNRQENTETNIKPSYYNFVTQANQLQYLQSQTKQTSTEPLKLPHHFPNFDPYTPIIYKSMQDISNPNSLVYTNTPKQTNPKIRDIKREKYLRKKRLQKRLLDDDLKNLC